MMPSFSLFLDTAAQGDAVQDDCGAAAGVAQCEEDVANLKLENGDIADGGK